MGGGGWWWRERSKKKCSHACRSGRIHSLQSRSQTFAASGAQPANRVTAGTPTTVLHNKHSAVLFSFSFFNHCYFPGDFLSACLRRLVESISPRRRARGRLEEKRSLAHKLRSETGDAFETFSALILLRGFASTSFTSRAPPTSTFHYFLGLFISCPISLLFCELRLPLCHTEHPEKKVSTGLVNALPSHSKTQRILL